MPATLCVTRGSGNCFKPALLLCQTPGYAEVGSLMA